jgi:putative transposase
LRRLAVLWSPSWLVSTVGGAPLEVVCRYVENQKAGS